MITNLSKSDLQRLDGIVFDYLRTKTRDGVGLHPGVVEQLERIRTVLREGYGATGPRERFGRRRP